MNARPRFLPGFTMLLLALLPLALAAAPAAKAPAGPAPVAGVDYVEIVGGSAFAPVAGKIEVAEAFGYTCGHCANFEPRLSAWTATLPADVQFTAVAAPFGGFWIPYARAYYAAQSLGLAEATHAPLFRALHEERSLPLTQPTREEIATFYAAHGADRKRFIAAMASPAVEAQLERARKFLRDSGVEGTPTLIVNGKYRVTGGKSAEDVLRITEHLIARERAALPRAPVRRQQATPAPSR